MATRIELTKGYFAIVDDEDAERVRAFKWRVTLRNTVAYAGRGWREGKVQKHQYLHRFIVNAPAGTEVDHIDGDGLNCTKANLRVVTHAQNAMNRRAVRGFRFHKGLWQAHITVAQKQIHLGSFATQAEAMAARQAAVAKFFGQFGRGVSA